MSFAFAQPTLTWAPTWTSLDELHPSLVAGYSIDRGRQYELDRCDTGRATITISDTEGLLDPTNPSSAYGADIDPLTQVKLARWNPVADEWQTRFRGFVEDLDYAYDPSQKVNRLTVSLVDIFELVSTIEMQPGEFGDEPPAGSPAEDQVFFDDAGDETDWTGMKIRCVQVLTNCGLSSDWYVCFSGNVAIQETVYSPGQSAMDAIQEACDAEFPSVGNVFGNRFGQLAIHGRYARFDPAGTWANTTPGRWDWHDWKAGDGAAVAASPSDTAHVRQFGTARGLAKLLNQAKALPKAINREWTAAEVKAQLVKDADAIEHYGIRSWSAENLLTKYGTTDGVGPLAETKRFATYYVENYAAPVDRISSCALRSMRPSAVGAGATWELLSECDIGDRLTVTVDSPGGGGFHGDGLETQHLVEGIHEEVRPLGVAYDDVTLTLDVSPFLYSEHNPFAPFPDVDPET